MLYEQDVFYLNALGSRAETMSIYKNLLRPILFSLDAEVSHSFVQKAACFATPLWPALRFAFEYSDKNLETSLASVALANPLGLAAGFDKNGKLTEVVGEIGFGFAEIGSVTARASKGNPQPRLFRLVEDEALINRMGLNGDGAEVVAERLQSAKFSLPVGLNIAKTNDPAISGDKAVEDVLETFAQIKHLPLAYVTLNVSCPNTREAQLAESNLFATIVSEVQKANNRSLPIFVKLSPDSSDELIAKTVECAKANNLRGFVCTNTTNTRAGLKTDQAKLAQIGQGGLSGPPLKNLALSLCDKVYRLKEPAQEIIACGGIASGEDAYQFIRRGAQVVQIYTALVFSGPGLPARINRELSGLLKRDGLTLADARGLDVCRAAI